MIKKPLRLLSYLVGGAVSLGAIGLECPNGSNNGLSEQSGSGSSGGSGGSGGSGNTVGSNSEGDPCDNPFGLTPVSGCNGETNNIFSREFYATHDSYTTDNEPFKNFGRENLIFTGDYNLLYDDSRFTGFIKFDLSRIPKDADILESKLRMVASFNNSLKKPQGSLTINYVTNTSWSENNLNAINRPTTGTHVLSRRITFETGETYSFDVKDVVEKWVSGSVTNRGFSITSRNFDLDYGSGGAFYSNEFNESAGPRLRVRWQE